MASLQVGLLCGTCSHDWVQDLGEIDNVRVVVRGDRQATIYLVPCPMCVGVVLVGGTCTVGFLGSSRCGSGFVCASGTGGETGATGGVC